MNSHRSTAARRTRRQLLGAGLPGAGASLGVQQHAAAQWPQSVPVPVSQDEAAREILLHALSVELAARDLYRAAVAEREDVDPLDVFQVFGDNHQAYSSMLAAQVGEAAVGQRDDAFFEGWESSFADTDDVAVAEAAYAMESQLVATYIDAIGQLDNVDAANRVAAMLTGEARHCAILADVAGRSDDMSYLLDNDAAPMATSTEFDESASEIDEQGDDESEVSQ